MRKRLDKLLSIAETTFTNLDAPSFSSELLEIPELIVKLLPFSGLKETPPILFWNGVESLNKDKPLLKLSKRLTALVENAAKLPRGPFVRLVSDYKDGVLPVPMKPLLIELDSFIYRAEENLDGEKVKADRWRDLPVDLTRFIPLLERTLSTTYRALVGVFDPTSSPDAAKTWAYTAFLDLVWQVHDWNKRYFEPLQGLATLLTYLHNEKFDKILSRIIYSPGPSVDVFVAFRQRQENAAAKRGSRALGGAKSRKFKRPRDDSAELLKGTL